MHNCAFGFLSIQVLWICLIRFRFSFFPSQELKKEKSLGLALLEFSADLTMEKFKHVQKENNIKNSYSHHSVDTITNTWPILFYLCLVLHCGGSLVSESCVTLCNPTDSSLPGSSVHGISQEEYWSGLPFPSPRHESEK